TWGMGEIFTTTIHIGRESTGSQYNTAFGTNDASAVRGTNYRTDDAAVIVDDQVLGFGFHTDINAHIFCRFDQPSNQSGAVDKLHTALVGGHIPNVRDDPRSRVRPTFWRWVRGGQDILQMRSSHAAHAQK